MSSLTELTSSLPFFNFKQRNAMLDNVFYDTPGMTPDEIGKLSPLVDREGTIIVVPPSRSGEPIRHYKKALRFMNKEGRTIRAIAVAGVGSSVVGTAALARNVADAFDFDVAGIVTGYGMTDLMSEALGGWFAFGAADSARLAFESMVEKARTTMPDSNATMDESGTVTLESLWGGRSVIPGDNDVATLSEILLAHPEKLEFLVGHSKGCLVIDSALQQFIDDLEGDASDLFERLRVVTLGAVVDLPSRFTRVNQFLGALDWFGGMNSRLTVPHERVPGAWHHLNRNLRYHMDARAVLASLH
jgi:hypothetical protein